MTPGPRYRKCTPALWRGPVGRPLALSSTEWLGVLDVMQHACRAEVPEFMNRPRIKCFLRAEY